MPKRSIRQNLLTQRRALDTEAYRKMSLAVQQRLIDTDQFRQALTVALYVPIHNEVQTDALLHVALQYDKQVCYPRVVEETLEFVVVRTVIDLARGAFGIAEPIGREVVAPEVIDLAVMPGVGFDRTGHRLGYGGGYYDRAIGAGRPKMLAGLAFDFQLVEELPAEGHDVRLDLVVTDLEVLAF